MMRKSVISLGLAATALLAGCYEKADTKETGASGPLYRHHFAGMTQILKGTNAAKLKEVWALKSSAEVRQQLLDKLAVAPREFWRKQLPTTASDQKELLRPLLDDLVNSESYLEIKGPSTRPEAVLAVRLSPDRLTLWNNNLGRLASAWNVGALEPFQAGASKGWIIKRKQDGGLIQVAQAGEWILVGIGQDKLTLLPPLLEQAARGGRPVPALFSTNPTMLLSLDADLPHLKKWFPFLAQSKMPPIHADLTGEGEYIRTKMQMRFSDKIPWKPEPWKIPTDVINEPLCGFTVGQGIAPFLPELKGVSQLGLKNYPDQFCIWSESRSHFLTFVSAPLPNASNVLRQIAPKIPAFLQQYFPGMAGKIGIASNRSEVVWSGLPMILPFLQTTNIHGTDYIVGGVLPVFKRTNSPPPAELFRQFTGRNELMYYDWEITEQSLIHSRQFWQLMDIVDHRTFARTNAPSVQWITQAASHLGNTITEVTRTAPNELSLMRKSHLGLTGSELVVLFRWLESSAFPFGYEPPPKIGANWDKSRPQRPPQQNRGVKTNVPPSTLPTPTPTLPAPPKTK